MKDGVLARASAMTVVIRGSQEVECDGDLAKQFRVARQSRLKAGGVGGGLAGSRLLELYTGTYVLG